MQVRTTNADKPWFSTVVQRFSPPAALGSFSVLAMSWEPNESLMASWHVAFLSDCCILHYIWFGSLFLKLPDASLIFATLKYVPCTVPLVTRVRVGCGEGSLLPNKHEVTCRRKRTNFCFVSNLPLPLPLRRLIGNIKSKLVLQVMGISLPVTAH